MPEKCYGSIHSFHTISKPLGVQGWKVGVKQNDDFFEALQNGAKRHTKLTLTCSKSQIKTREKGKKYVTSLQ